MDETGTRKGTLEADDHDLRVRRPWGLSEGSVSALLIVLVPTILVIDYTSGRDISLHLFYLIPTGLAAWSFGARAGYAVGFMAAAYWAFVGFATRHPAAPVTALAWDVVSTAALFLFFAFVVARHRSFVERLVATARLDPSCGALSKREFHRLLETEVRRTHRYRRPLAIALLDFATAKAWAGGNRRHLSAAVRAVQSQIRDSDAVGRIAERRLGIIFVECPAAEAFRVAARVRDALHAAVKLDAQPPAIGLASYAGASSATAAELLQIASAQTTLAQDGPGLSERRVE